MWLSNILPKKKNTKDEVSKHKVLRSKSKIGYRNLKKYVCACERESLSFIYIRVSLFD